MKTTLYYFSGTGNSFFVARRVASELGEAELISIASVMRSGGDIRPETGRIGIICPVYDLGIPVIVGEFLKRLNVQEAEYLFAIITMGGSGLSALRMIDTIIRGTSSKCLDAGFAVKMPGNFLPLHSPPTGIKLNHILKKAGSEVDRICRIIRQGKKHRPGPAILSSFFKFFVYKGFASGVHTLDQHFSVSDRCTGCGTCAEVCPTKNIVVDDRPAWNHRCELCLACLHFCPTEAINLRMMRGTENRGRYHHPDITIEDMRNQQGSR